jgi:signal transduction histidine kinase
MRRLLAVLRADEPPGELAPSPGLDRLPALIDRARAAGVDVTLDVTGAARAVPPSLDLSAYRMVQDALTNVGKHAAGAPASIALHWGQSALSIEIRNPGSKLERADTNGSGHGLIGMRERARMLDGEFNAGPAPGGGFVVSATLPYPEASWSAS